jgi:tetratricopeptide (TPR) repeat protein
MTSFSPQAFRFRPVPLQISALLLSALLTMSSPLLGGEARAQSSSGTTKSSATARASATARSSATPVVGEGAKSGETRSDKPADENENDDASPEERKALDAAWDQLGKGELSAAIDAYDRILALDPNQWEALYGRGVASARAENPQGAIEDLNRAIELNSDEASAYFWRGFAYGWLSEYEKAIEDFTRAHLLTDSRLLRVDALVYRSMNLKASGQLDKALADANEAIRLDPKQPGGWTSRAQVRLAQGDATGAQQDSDKATAIDPDFGLALQSYQGVQVGRLILYGVLGAMALLVVVGGWSLSRTLLQIGRASKKEG